jgi:hypothetical protein
MYGNNRAANYHNRLHGDCNPHVVAAWRAEERKREREREARIAATPEGKKAAREQALRLDEAKREQEHQKRIEAVRKANPPPPPKPTPKPPVQEPLTGRKARVVEKVKRRILHAIEASQKA